MFQGIPSGIRGVKVIQNKAMTPQPLIVKRWSETASAVLEQSC